MLIGRFLYRNNVCLGISTDFDPNNATLMIYRNGAIVQEDNTGNIIFSVARILSFVSSFMSLWPGDLVIAVTTASGIGQLHGVDTLEVEIEGIGRLSNPVHQGRQ